MADQREPRASAHSRPTSDPSICFNLSGAFAGTGADGSAWHVVVSVSLVATQPQEAADPEGAGEKSR
jgi:hypothetical protein